MALGLDQVPESMLPAFASRWFEPLSLLDVALVVGLFFVGELVLSRILYIWKIRDRPY
jgi:CDP-2,3-bis-(O-geranylgeranyl)-sn-glycerol synthase